MTTARYTLYGAAGSGSVAVEAALDLIGAHYNLIDIPTWESDAQRERMAAVNPMRQVPALLLPGGELLTAAAIYAMYWVHDVPSRLAEGAEAERTIEHRTIERIAECWRMMDAQVSPGRYILGDTLSVLDLYVAVVSRWSPRRERFAREAPRLAQVVARVDADTRLTELWSRRFPASA
ncbi:glutathione S-transferase family protein [Ramlibacter sp.]|uniref:glutathione S-transferase family protein n=1 Tax=Ramlibacter sp. TaxID=1917967 RepID=UPI00181C7496|nr:glutathione S-transferase family protein [Ramlibacter sp.]MBA2675246.1 glutathione S-transferase family protein [Ramlibacter sp.]